MYNLPTETRKIKERIRRYERAFAKEMQEFNMIPTPAITEASWWVGVKSYTVKLWRIYKIKYWRKCRRKRNWK